MKLVRNPNDSSVFIDEISSWSNIEELVRLWQPTLEDTEWVGKVAKILGRQKPGTEKFILQATMYLYVQILTIGEPISPLNLMYNCKVEHKGIKYIRSE